MVNYFAFLKSSPIQASLLSPAVPRFPAHRNCEIIHVLSHTLWVDLLSSNSWQYRAMPSLYPYSCISSQHVYISAIHPILLTQVIANTCEDPKRKTRAGPTLQRWQAPTLSAKGMTGATENSRLSACLRGNLTELRTEAARLDTCQVVPLVTAILEVSPEGAASPRPS